MMPSSPKMAASTQATPLRKGSRGGRASTRWKRGSRRVSTIHATRRPAAKPAKTASVPRQPPVARAIGTARAEAIAEPEVDRRRVDAGREGRAVREALLDCDGKERAGQGDPHPDRKREQDHEQRAGRHRAGRSEDSEHRETGGDAVARADPAREVRRRRVRTGPCRAPERWRAGPRRHARRPDPPRFEAEGARYRRAAAGARGRPGRAPRAHRTRRLGALQDPPAPEEH